MRAAAGGPTYTAGMLQRTFSKGDRVVHLDKPEWGGGLITKTQYMSREGTQVQFVTVRFDHAGLKSLSAAHARLSLEAEYLRADFATPGKPARPAESGPQAGRRGSGGSLTPAEQAAGSVATGDLAERLLQLPEETCDPFLQLDKRIDATLRLYRFDGSARSLIDWGIVQSGFADPLAHFSRHELELLFDKWQRGRDQHLADLLEKLRRDDPLEHRARVGALPAKVRQALQRRNTRR